MSASYQPSQMQQYPNYQQLQLSFIPTTNEEIEYFYPSNFNFTPDQKEIIARLHRLPHPISDIKLTEQQIMDLNAYHKEQLLYNLSPQSKTNMQVYYNKIAMKLSELFNNPNVTTMDPYLLKSFINSNEKIPSEKMPEFFKHLLLYTYASTATEIENHQEVNKHLADINKKITELLNKELLNKEQKMPGQ